MVIVVIGIDPSLTATGVVIISDQQLVDHKILTTKKKSIERLLAFENMLTEILDTYQPQVVAIEGYSYASPHQAHQLGELGGIIRRLLYIKSIPYMEIPPTKVKKYATGKGNAPKDLILQQVYKKWGVEFSTPDEADAYVLARMVSDGVVSPQKETTNK